jgi:hypothetical protein
MAYDSSTLSMVSFGPVAVGSRNWIHTSADAGSTVQVTGFITDGGNRGMKVGDVLQHTNTSTKIVSRHRVMTVSATAPGVVDLSDSTTDASGTNTD